MRKVAFRVSVLRFDFVAATVEKSDLQKLVVVNGKRNITARLDNEAYSLLA